MPFSTRAPPVRFPVGESFGRDHYTVNPYRLGPSTPFSHSVARSGVTVEANAMKFKEMSVMPELIQWKTVQQSKRKLPHILADGQMPFIMAPLANTGDFASEPGGK